MAAYSAAKHGVIGLTRSLALELGAFNITVNAVCPGFVETQLFEGLINMVGSTRNLNREQVLKTFVNQVPMGRMQTGEDVANVVAFLASDKASYISGVNLMVDGGWMAY